MKKLDRLIQLRALKQQRHKISILHRMDAKRQENLAAALRDEKEQEAQVLTSAHNNFLAQVLARSNAIVDPSARIASISWKIRARQNEMVQSTKAFHRAHRDLQTMAAEVQKADIAVKVKKHALDQFDDLVATAKNEERQIAELREEELLTEMMMTSHLADTMGLK